MGSCFSKGEETVSIPELKIVIAKALGVLIAKLDTNMQTDEKIFTRYTSFAD